MTRSEQMIIGVRLLREGWSDEDTERLTGISLAEIIELRAEAASRPMRRFAHAALKEQPLKFDLPVRS